MRCQDVRQLLSEYLDGVLDSAHNKIVEEHLANCRECRLYWQALKADARLLRDLPEVAPPPGFRAELIAKLNNLERKEKKKGSRGKSLPFVSRLVAGPWIAGVAAAVLIFVVGLASFGGSYLGNIISPEGIFRVSNSGKIIEPSTGERSADEVPDHELSGGGPGDEDVEPGSGGFGEDLVAHGPGSNKASSGSDQQREGDDNSAGRDSSGKDTSSESGSGSDFVNPGVGTSEVAGGEEGISKEQNGSEGAGEKEVFVASGDEIKIVRKVQVGITAGEVESTVEKITDIAGLYGGLSRGNSAAAEDVTRVELLVPAAQLHRVISEVEKLGQVYQEPQSENEDVTEKYNGLVNAIKKIEDEKKQLTEQLTGCSEDQRVELESKIESLSEQLKEKLQEKKTLEERINNALVVVLVKCNS